METAAPKKLFFFELCRLCLENAGVRDIFETNNLLEDIYNCTGVKMSCSDNLPRKICINCSDVVANSKELRLLACKNDAHLRVLFGGVQDDDSTSDNVQTSNHSPHKTSIPESRCSEVKTCYFESSPDCKNQNSSKEKLSLLLKEGEGIEATPVIRQTISLRKDLFAPSSTTSSPVKSQTEFDPDDRLLQVKVESENTYKKIIKTGEGDDEEIEYICGICCKAFDKYKKLYLHQRLHNKKIHCPLDACGKKFTTKGDLEKHLRTHTGEKPYQCNICEKGFTQRVTLRVHITTVHSKDVKKNVDEHISNGKASVIEKSQG